jgi:multidrug efflux pump subunit AcrA (membrane-fusion protein)
MRLAALQPTSLFFGRDLTTRQLTTIRVGSWSGGILLIAAVLGGLAFVLGAGSSPVVKDETAPAIPVSTLTLEPVQQFDAERTFTGLLVAGRTSELAFERAGEVVEVSVDQGRRVSAGEVLARLDTQHVEARRDELTARRRQAAALLDELIAGPRQEQIAAAQAEVRNLAAQVEWQRVRHERRANLRQRGVIAQEEFDESQYSLQATDAQHDAARKRLDELLAGTRAEQKEAQAAVVAQLDASLAQVEVDLRDSVLVAPFAGIVARRHVDEGTVVAAGASVLRLVEDGRLEAHIGLPPELAATLNAGDVRPVTVNGREHSAYVQAVLPELDAVTRTRTVVLQLDAEAAGGLVPGQVARVAVSQQQSVDGFWLPTTALDRGTRGLWSALAVVQQDDGSLHTERRQVEVLHTDADCVLVRGVLAAGDRIVDEGVHRIVEGQVVNVQE